MKFKNQEYKVFINPSYISELKGFKIKDSEVVFGAAITLSELQDALKEIINTYGGKIFIL